MRDELDVSIRHQEAQAIAEAEAEGRGLYQGMDPIVDDYVRQTYDDVAYSHTAVAALTALFEGIFKHEFGVLKELDRSDPIQKVSLEPRSAKTGSHFWNPADALDVSTGNWRLNICEGALQILAAIDLLKHFPSDFIDVLKFLFRYRNNALHNGYEWLVKDREGFLNKLRNDGHEDWFDKATIASHPWVITMADSFVQRCFDVAEITTTVLSGAVRRYKLRGATPRPLLGSSISSSLSPSMRKALEGLNDSSSEVFKPLRKSVPRTQP